MGRFRLRGPEALALFAFGALAFAQRRVGVTDPMSSPARRQPDPTRWAIDKLNHGLQLWRGPAGDALRRYSATMFPNAPPSAFLGFILNGGQREVTSIGEMGWGGIESVTRWNELARSPEVRAMLGRAGIRGEGDAWKDAVDDQIAITLANIAAHADGCARLIPAAAPTVKGGQWHVSLAFGAWSAGNSGYASHLRALRGAWVNEVERDKWSGVIVGASEYSGAHVHEVKHSNPCYTVLRTAQKMEASRMIAERAGEDTSWWALTGAVTPAVIATLTAKANGQ